jgi:hypothetical protein
MASLTDPLLLRIIWAIVDAGRQQALLLLTAEARACDDGGDAWHPAHLARLACVSRCVSRRGNARERRSVPRGTSEETTARTVLRGFADLSGAAQALPRPGAHARLARRHRAPLPGGGGGHDGGSD